MINVYGASASVRQPHGIIICDDRQVADTVQCVHCQRHWVIEKGSGKKRGFCMNCGGITCGSDKCHVCLPFEKRLELYEAGKISSL